ncbi:glutamate receptor ionotropic, delta-2-like [Eriocheir sinensis]|uniref:glutamate receptor ionotropic, delta-2-like n=1 Tax=Eriocheir sinensis TaxID=95602 RepID=UPI0021C68B24|nr:glutamate receptor ionotropic, delta-2-like [Eriocheir sinensis]
MKGEDGEWTGMVGRLARQEADIGVANLFLTLTRQGAVDYSAPYDAEVSCFLVRTEPAVPRWLSLALPFQMSTWGAILLGVLVTGVLIYIFAIASDSCGGEAPLLRSLSFACFYASGMHFRGSFYILPSRHSTRTFICFLWIYVIIITTAYSSNLTAFLTVTHRPQGINTIRSLYSTRMEVSGLGSFFKGALASAVDPYLQGLGERFVPYQKLDLVWSRVRGGEAAYLHNKQFLEFVIATQFTERKGVASMRIMKECFAPYSIAMALQRHSPLKRKFDRVISWMLESGLVRHWFLESLRLSRKVKTKKNNEYVDETNPVNVTDRPAEDRAVQGVIPLSINHMQGVFLLFLFGNLSALLVVLLECGHHRVFFSV